MNNPLHAHHDTPAEILRAYRLPTFIVFIGIIIAVMGFLMALKYDMNHSERTYEEFSGQIFRALDADIRRHEQQISLGAQLIGQIDKISQNEYRDVSKSLMNDSHFIDVSLYERFENGTAAEYFSAQSSKTETLTASPQLEAAIGKSRAQGKPYFSRPFEIFDKDQTLTIAFIVAPVPERYLKNVFVVGVINLSDQFKESFHNNQETINVRVYDIYELDKKLFYEQYEEQGREFFSSISEDRFKALHFQRTRFFDDHQWDVHIFSSLRGFASYVGLFPWITFAAALAVTGLLGYIVFRITVENVKTAILIEKQTRSLREYAERLEASNRDLDDFAYIASHDLKEPLRGIYNYAEFLFEDYSEKIDEDGKNKLMTLKKLARRMESLIESLLEFSRVSREDLTFKRTDTNQIVHEVLETLNVWVRDNKAQITIQDNLPTIDCDPVRTGEIFRNLIVNAVKYNNKTIKMVEVGCMHTHSQAPGIPTFFVKDNGIGIPEEHQKTVFKIFKRLHGRDEYGGGTGSGLTIVWRIIGRHGGRIWIESKLNEGTTFFFTLSKGAHEARK